MPRQAQGEDTPVQKALSAPAIMKGFFGDNKPRLKREKIGKVDRDVAFEVLRGALGNDTEKLHLYVVEHTKDNEFKLLQKFSHQFEVAESEALDRFIEQIKALDDVDFIINIFTNTTALVQDSRSLFALQTGKDVLAEYGLLVRNLRKNTYIELLNAVSQLEQEIANVLIAPAVQGSNLSQLAVAQEEEFATERFRMNYQDELSEARLTSALLQVLPRDREIVIVCIGTDRNTGDALGPFVGTKLMESLSGEEVTIYGSIDDPVHAINLEKTLDQISMKHGMPFILAIDAALGKLSSVGSIDMFKGSLKPGAGVGKKLPEVGSYSIMGIVNVGGFMEYYVLSNTRLSLIMRMADVIANSIARAVTIIQEQTAESNEEPPVREAI